MDSLLLLPSIVNNCFISLLSNCFSCYRLILFHSVDRPKSLDLLSRFGVKFSNRVMFMILRSKSSVDLLVLSVLDKPTYGVLSVILLFNKNTYTDDLQKF